MLKVAGLTIPTDNLKFLQMLLTHNQRLKRPQLKRLSPPVDGCRCGFQVGWVHEGAEPGAGGHERQRAGGTAAQGLQATVRGGSVGVQRG